MEICCCNGFNDQARTVCKREIVYFGHALSGKRFDSLRWPFRCVLEISVAYPDLPRQKRFSRIHVFGGFSFFQSKFCYNIKKNWK